MPLIEDPVHEYFTNHLDNLMVKHIYIFTLISIFMPIWVRFIVFEKEYFCSSGRRIKCKWDVGNMCFTIIERIVDMLSKQKKIFKIFVLNAIFLYSTLSRRNSFFLTPFHLSKESFSCKSSIRNKELREKSQQDLDTGFSFSSFILLRNWCGKELESF